jgi:HEAT repeat protein
VYPELELERRSLAELLALFQDGTPAEEEASLYYSEVAWYVGRRGDEAAEALVALIPAANDEQLRAILFALGVDAVSAEVAGAVLPLYLADERDLIQAEAIASLGHRRDRRLVGHTDAFLRHPSHWVRARTLEYLSRLTPAESKSALHDALTDTHYIVREVAVDQLDEIEDRAAIPWITPLLYDSHPHVRQAARTAIKNLGGSR